MTETIEFRKAIVPDEIAALCEFDRAVFHDYPFDVFPPQEWMNYESYWMIVNGKNVGCAALRHDPDQLWIASTGILREFRGRGLGKKLKQWEIDYARLHGFTRVGTITRESNKGMIGLNEKFGFVRRKTVPGHYANPDDSGVEMELRLLPAPSPTCPKCGKALRTPRAKQCRYCGADWHH